MYAARLVIQPVLVNVISVKRPVLSLAASLALSVVQQLVQQSLLLVQLLGLLSGLYLVGWWPGQLLGL
ncbi:MULTISPECIES: hypothetical protein [unclassified Enterobacter]|uniref:hypothetical protein n=1 Tax=unclassified Enterobacter TaxID=2608935 RepID=UPI00292C70C7|nr:hypothetical protein [Enterobacter sp. 23-M-SZ-13]MDV0595518.1 hypothetical protein [Enterobacter sp. 23-M-SZ-13]